MGSGLSRWGSAWGQSWLLSWGATQEAVSAAAGSYEERARKRRKQREEVYEQIQALKEIEPVVQKRRKRKPVEIVLPVVEFEAPDYEDDILMLLAA